MTIINRILLLSLPFLASCGGSSSNKTPEVDTVSPAITLNGESQIFLRKGSTYNEKGATANDNVDGEVPVSQSGKVNTHEIGTYTISYSAIDNSGNQSTAERLVQIVPVDTDYLQKWSSLVGTDNQYESFEDLTVINNGKIYAVGKSSTSNSSNNGALYRISADVVEDSSTEQISSQGLIANIDDKDGSTIWSLAADESKASILYSVASDSNDNLVAVGSTQTTTNALILKLDSDGNELWRKEFGGPDNNLLAEVAIDNEDNIYVFAIRLYDGKASLLKYNSDGDLLNTIELEPEYASLDHNRYGIVIDSNNNVYVTGYIISPIIWKFDQNGVMQWKNVFPEGTVGFKYVHKILLRGDFLYAIGYWSSEDAPLYDYGLLVKLDSNGNTILDVRYLGSGSIGARFQDFAINADGTITAVGYAHFTDSPEILPTMTAFYPIA